MHYNVFDSDSVTGLLTKVSPYTPFVVGRNCMHQSYHSVDILEYIEETAVCLPVVSNNGFNVYNSLKSGKGE